MKKFIYTALSFAPVMALAVGTTNTTDLGNVKSLVKNIGEVINSIIPVLFALALVYFFWGLIVFIRAAGDPAEASKGKSIMIYGVIALAVMVSIYGLIGWLQGTLGIQAGGDVDLPSVDLDNTN